MCDVLQICRDYGAPLSWWDGLSREERVLYSADLRLRQTAEIQRLKGALRRV